MIELIDDNEVTVRGISQGEICYICGNKGIRGSK